MIKTWDVIREAIHSTKHPFRKTDNRPKKALKHRYERRKVNEYIRIGNQVIEETL